jgi:trehalose utilization protein
MFTVGIYTSIDPNITLSSYFTIDEIDIIAKTLYLHKSTEYKLVYTHTLHSTIKETLLALNITTKQDVVLRHHEHVIDEILAIADILLYFKLDLGHSPQHSNPETDLVLQIERPIIHTIYLPMEV